MEEIVIKMNRSKSTISRELKRNCINRCIYLPDTAQVKMQIRRQQSKSISASTIKQVKQYLEQYHSPEQIAGRMKRDELEQISPETIYQMIYTNHSRLRECMQYLRQAHKKRHRRTGKHQKRGRILDRVGIEQRPAMAGLKTEIDHWESDTVIGVNHAEIITYVDKASKFLLAGLANNKTVQQINQMKIRLFGRIDATLRKNMTFDNGKACCGHQKLADVLNVTCYFGNPYHFREQGLNEHTNGLLRQFCPSGTNFKLVKPEVLKHVFGLINHRPRKSLDFQMPYEVISSHPSVPIALQI